MSSKIKWLTGHNNDNEREMYIRNAGNWEKLSSRWRIDSLIFRRYKDGVCSSWLCGKCCWVGGNCSCRGGGSSRQHRRRGQSLQCCLICLEIILPLFDLPLRFIRSNGSTNTLHHGCCYSSWTDISNKWWDLSLTWPLCFIMAVSWSATVRKFLKHSLYSDLQVPKCIKDGDRWQKMKHSKHETIAMLHKYFNYEPQNF